ncbi:Bcr/CflA family multidrug efflux MFS transporter [Ursidibacter maritimus]|uniref:Bcr/CflA family efflux transporter n=1 Tax=Ursidibacter maritimus TaxID=1331689 RepID=A0A949T4Y1_9PAST|nr:Bcr/CflA family multidrug efflux MFS transporter [Ursidibacter maritimus]KAE9538270.1 Bcr/CflA family multidrug efflux transporter [Ursidibacter maritimus]MBV6524552.1 Bcr/CflA family multidrug efflux MFS transporter [Ursidibacter maritimus]MBV6525588.1 Bcr/CflA family multidrug efflux MFS transporter [Ursidibacter maritimus]MBV6527674.1 Bcr/CflA family multidrug efflux MFS transporter [Ursidibacter maritimus]MBV6529565.1 Bcr/CflA family multidrug efflux MFS transporter [Ursidibacter mariti
MNATRPTGFFVVILGLLSMLPPLAIDMYLPSFLDIAQDLNVSQEKVQTTLAIFTFGFAIGQLFWGPIADSFGRKPIILLGLSGGAVASFFLTQVANIENFYLLRFIQGLFGAAPAVVLGALVRDLFERNQFARMMSTIMIITMVAPLLAPIVGGHLAHWFHWHAIFYLLMVMGIICASLFAIGIPETLKQENKAPLNFTKVLKNFVALISHKATLGYVLVGGLSFSGMFCFLTSGSLVYIGLYGVSAEYFGYFFMLNIGVMIVMTFINGRLVTQIGSEKMLRIGLTLQFIAGIWLAISATFELGLWSMAIGIAIFVGMVSTIGSNASAAILDRYPQMAGTANALAGTARFGIASLIGAGLSHIPLNTERPMLYMMATCTFVASICYYFLACRNSD